MMSKLLEYLKKGGDANISTISRKLDMQEGTVEMLLDQLVKLGYLEVMNSSTNTSTECSPIKCKGCGHSTDCIPLLKIKYRLTEKGRI